MGGTLTSVIEPAAKRLPPPARQEPQLLGLDVGAGRGLGNVLDDALLGSFPGDVATPIAPVGPTHHVRLRAFEVGAEGREIVGGAELGEEQRVAVAAAGGPGVLEGEAGREAARL